MRPSSREHAPRGDERRPRSGQPRGPHRKKLDPFAGPKGVVIHHLNVRELARFLDESGRIVPGRRSGASAKNLRRLTRALKRARNLALLPFVQR
ncbi:MAG: 30S ribosomal protein S18 [Deltaproteobacteria bacterium]|nr:30S ribosomal protein S18 [Deltaproteobacteria bacterium]